MKTVLFSTITAMMLLAGTTSLPVWAIATQDTHVEIDVSEKRVKVFSGSSMIESYPFQTSRPQALKMQKEYEVANKVDFSIDGMPHEHLVGMNLPAQASPIISVEDAKGQTLNLVDQSGSDTVMMGDTAITLSEEDLKTIFDNVDIGTPVRVVQ